MPTQNHQKPTVKDVEDYLLAKQPEVYDFYSSLLEETDRGCALMAAAYIDEQLKNLLKRSFVQNAKILNKIFDTNGPLGTFSSRIDFAYINGHIGPKAHKDLHLLRLIRNDFGHSAKPLTFECPSIKDRCRDLYHDLATGKPAPRKKFIRVVMGVLGPIHVVTAMLIPKDEANDPKIDDDAKKWFKDFVDWSISETKKLNS